MKKTLSLLVVLSMAMMLLSFQRVTAATYYATLEADTFVYARDPIEKYPTYGNNYGADPTLIVSRLSTKGIPIVRFDISNIPANETVTSAKLRFTVKTPPTNAVYPATNPTSFAQYNLSRYKDASHPVDDWAEGSGTITSPTTSGGVTGADTAGYLPTAVSTLTWSASYTAESVIEFDVKSLIEAERSRPGTANKISFWINNPADNIGAGNIGNLVLYSQNDTANPSKKPQLEITTQVLTQDEQDVAAAKSSLNISNLNCIASDVILPTVGANGTTISWASSNPEIISTDGRVTRPGFDALTNTYAGNATVTLTATIAKGSASDTKQFTATVLSIKHPEADAYTTGGSSSAKNYGASTTLTVRDYDYRMAWLRFALPNIPEGKALLSAKLRLFKTSITGDINKVDRASSDTWIEGTYNDAVPANGDNAITYDNKPSYNTNNTSIKTVDGTSNIWVEFDVTSILMSDYASGNSKTTLVVHDTGSDSTNVSYNSKEAASNRPELILNVVDRNDQTDVNAATATLSLGDISSVRGNLSLPSAGSYGTSITWSSDNPAISNQGIVTRPAADMSNIIVTLTATVTKNAATATKQFTATVLSNRYPEADTYVESNNPDKNYGNNSLMVVKTGGPTRAGFIRYNLNNITGAISGAKLRITFFSSSNPNFNPAQTKLIAVADDGWDENAATYNNTTAMLASDRVIAYGAWVSGQTNLIEFDVTDFAQEEQAGNKLMTVMIYTDDPNQNHNFYTVDSPYKPELILTTTSDPDTSAVIADRAALVYPASVTQDIILPAAGANGSTITWQSDNPSAVSAAGNVTRPAYKTTDAFATLTATITKNAVTQTKVIKLRVPQYAGVVVADPVYKSGDTVISADEITNNTSVTSEFSVNNDLPTGSPVTVVAALYDSEGRIVRISLSNDSLAPAEVKTVSAALSLVGKQAGYSMKLFVVDGLSNIKPLKSMTKIQF